ncbi:MULTISPECIES: TauD/TfdA family dioxygenase [Erwinia]|uniref:TauD/TfdA family dioxygenase n=1 Tax=Erwinia papayae TaxID=206499 RepID=A0ABV3MZ69_9GAMM|nr:TauD/TfdA family dioxygenase [Erwinia mallotivora]
MKSCFDGWQPCVINIEDKVAVIKHLEKYRFAVIENDWQYDDADFRYISDLYFLGDIYQSAFNRVEHEEGVFSSGVNQIGGLSRGTHVVFNSSAHLPLHTDGSYIPIGSIKTSILLCKQHASQGGETVLFDSVSAFQQLRIDYPDLANILLEENIFRRRSTGTQSGKQYSHIGPVFRPDENGGFIGGFTLDITADWEWSYKINPRVADAVDYLSQLATEGSRYFLTFPLCRGQALIFRNDKISHGRRAFTDDPACPRTLLRGMFVDVPKLSA